MSEAAHTPSEPLPSPSLEPDRGGLDRFEGREQGKTALRENRTRTEPKQLSPGLLWPTSGAARRLVSANLDVTPQAWNVVVKYE